MYCERRLIGRNTTKHRKKVFVNVAYEANTTTTTARLFFFFSMERRNNNSTHTIYAKLERITDHFNGACRAMGSRFFFRIKCFCKSATHRLSK